MTDGYGLTPEQIKRGTMLRKQPKKREKSPGEEAMAQQLTIYKIPFEREVQFYSQRRWRFDFLLTGTKYAIEVEGGVFMGGAHSRGKHFEEDCIKYNSAAALDFKVLRFSTGQVTRGEAINFILRLSTIRSNPPSFENKNADD